MGSSGTSCRTGPRASTKYLDISDYSGDLLGFLVSYRPLAAKCLLGQSVAAVEDVHFSSNYCRILDRSRHHHVAAKARDELRWTRWAQHCSLLRLARASQE